MHRIYRAYSGIHSVYSTNPGRSRKKNPAGGRAAGGGKSAANRGVWKSYPKRRCGGGYLMRQIGRKSGNYTKFSDFHSLFRACRSVGFVGNVGGRRAVRTVDKQAFPRDAPCGKREIHGAFWGMWWKSARAGCRSGDFCGAHPRFVHRFIHNPPWLSTTC